MRIFGISDLHLSFDGKKPMDRFGPWWAGHVEKVEKNWRALVGEGDIVCLPGDFSWSMRPSEAGVELQWLSSLPGRKILLKGNHDYWWGSISKLRTSLPKGVYALQNDTLELDGVVFGGARGWNDPSIDFSGFSGHASMEEMEEGGSVLNGTDEDRKIFERELGRLDASLSRMSKGAGLKVALLHFPPTSPDLGETEVTRILEKHGVNLVLFGHAHRSGPTEFINPFGVKNSVTYYLVSADFIDFSPVEVYSDG